MAWRLWHAFLLGAVLAVFLALPGGVKGAWAAKIYTWTDDSGRIYLSDRPPPGDSSRVRVLKFRSSPAVNAPARNPPAQNTGRPEVQPPPPAPTDESVPKEPGVQTLVLSREAEAARDRAETARQKAAAATLAADELAEKVSKRSRKRRKRYRSRLKRANEAAARAVEESRAADQAALEAVQRDAAEANSASGEASSPEDPPVTRNREPAP